MIFRGYLLQLGALILPRLRTETKCKKLNFHSSIVEFESLSCCLFKDRAPRFVFIGEDS